MTDVPNPQLAWLQQLLSETQSAVAATPDIESPTKAIGPGTAWTGTRADQLHDSLLAPNAKAFQNALHELVHDVQAVIAKTPKKVPEAQAHAMEMMRAHAN